MTAMTEPIYQDGKWYEYGGYDAAGRVVRTEVDPPTVEMSAVVAEPEHVALPNPASLLLGAKHLDRNTIANARKGLFYRQPEADGTYGKWYQSAWFWFWVIVTAFFARWWISTGWPSMEPTNYWDNPQPPDAMDWFMALFGWLWWGWIPLGIGVTGALQKAGYKRFAVVYAVALAALIAAFFARSDRTSPNP